MSDFIGIRNLRSAPDFRVKEVASQIPIQRNQRGHRITQPEPAQVVLLAQLSWNLPQQPPPRVYAQDLPPAGPQLTLPPEAA
ncbi:MAG: hypothetical protein ACYC23_16350 [Limisphaerales bacterium]